MLCTARITALAQTSSSFLTSTRSAGSRSCSLRWPPGPRGSPPRRLDSRTSAFSSRSRS